VRPMLEGLEDSVTPTSVTAVALNHGPTSGGTTVAIYGSGFTGATEVDYGDVPASGWFVSSDTAIYGYSPAHTAGVVDVTVRAPGGTSATSSLDLFTYGTTTTTSLTSSAGTSTYGQSVTFTATISA